MHETWSILITQEQKKKQKEKDNGFSTNDVDFTINTLIHCNNQLMIQKMS